LTHLFAVGRAHLKPIVALVQAMGELLIGDPVVPFDIERKLRRRHALLGVHNVVLFAMSGIDMAAWDVCAKAAMLRGRMLDDEGGLYWIEEPTRADDFDGNGRIADELQTPVQIGENFMGPEQMAQALAAGASDHVMPDVERIGGVTGWMRAAALAQGAGLEMSSHLFPEVSCHLLAVTPTGHWLEYVDWATPVLQHRLAITNGHVQIPELPGTGISWNEKSVTKCAA
jgi:L-alanine-DL-glutamate epimerase-like enolase superfamily enzyme